MTRCKCCYQEVKSSSHYFATVNGWKTRGFGDKSQAEKYFSEMKKYYASQGTSEVVDLEEYVGY